MAGAPNYKLYRDNLQQFNQPGGLRHDVTAFTKIEKTSTNNYKPPRLIQARHPTFNIAYGRYIKPLEIKITKIHKNKIHFGKGNYDEIARRITVLAHKYKYYTELDHDSFDSRVTEEMLRLTHRFYKECYDDHYELSRLCNLTIDNKIHTRDGLKWKTHATRMSGDVDTSLGNSLINYAILKECLYLMGNKGEVIVNGDDSIIFTNQPVDRDLLVDILREFNMVSKVPKPSTTCIHQVEFCRTKLVYKSTGQPTMMFDPTRMINIFGMTHSQQDYQVYLPQLFTATTKLNNNTPVHHKIQNALKNHIKDYDPGVAQGKPKKIKQRGQFYALEHALIRMLANQSINIPEQSNTFNFTHYLAYPECIDLETQLDKLVTSYKTIKQSEWYYDTELLINHTSKRLMTTT